MCLLDRTNKTNDFFSIEPLKNNGIVYTWIGTYALNQSICKLCLELIKALLAGLLSRTNVISVFSLTHHLFPYRTRKREKKKVGGGDGKKENERKG